MHTPPQTNALEKTSLRFCLPVSPRKTEPRVVGTCAVSLKGRPDAQCEFEAHTQRCEAPAAAGSAPPLPPAAPARPHGLLCAERRLRPTLGATSKPAGADGSGCAVTRPTEPARLVPEVRALGPHPLPPPRTALFLKILTKDASVHCRERHTHRCGREIVISRLPYTPELGPNPQPRYVP